MRSTSLRIVGLLLIAAGFAATALRPARGGHDLAAELVEGRFRDRVRPVLDAYCVSCHGPRKPQGDLDLSTDPAAASIAGDLPRWNLVLEQLEAKSMPPAKAKRHPTVAAREEVIQWVRAVRKLEADRNAGDPGHVPPRRLSNAEYDHSIRDLTGVDIRPTREFPVDPANEAGFDNSAESLAMSPGLFKKYLAAARVVADHLVLKPDGIAFAPHPVVADTDRDKYCVRRVIDFYKRQRTDLAEFLLAAWRFRHREALGRAGVALADLAAEERLSPRYLDAVWTLLDGPAAEKGPIAALQGLWREVPPPGGQGNRGADAARLACERIRDFVVELRGRLTPTVPNLTVRGMNNGAQPLVLWKNHQSAANRGRYDGHAERIKPDDLKAGTAAARALSLPADPRPYEGDFARFCAIFPDAFVVSERARVYLDPKQEKNNAGRLLSAGFHSMTGYFRDDAPLSEWILDDRGRRDLDRLWLEFDVITGAPARQYASFLWFERTDSRFMRGPEFDFARAEDKGAGSDEMIRRLAEVYLAKARRNEADDTAVAAIRDYFIAISANIRRVERTRLEAEPSHLDALQQLAARAYRRPLSDAERGGILDFYHARRRDDGLGHDDAVRDTLVTILLSPHFCYRVDLPSAGDGIQPLPPIALASRLSYFLWSSLPDEELLALAASGELKRPEVLAAQARRMLRDDRVRGLATEFGGNWLDFRRFEEHNSVDRGRFPAFNDELRRSLYEEPIRFFIDLVRNDRPVSEFLDAHHTFVNPALARHYGIPTAGKSPDDWERIDDATPHGRGGLLPMGVFLTKNAPGLRTSPVKRGYWVVRRLLGETIPAPPANVPDLPSDEAKLGPLTLRETLARHRDDPSCVGCHERFDAIGLAFEGYGPVGERRAKDLAGHPVETKATFPGGVDGDGVAGLRSYLASKRRGEFLENLSRKLLAYGLGRSLIPSDDRTIETMRKRLAAGDGRFGDLVEAIVTSPQFRNKRVNDEAAE